MLILSDISFDKPISLETSNTAKLTKAVIPRLTTAFKAEVFAVNNAVFAVVAANCLP